MISLSEFICDSPYLSNLPHWQNRVSASTIHNGQRRNMCEDCQPLHPAHTQTEKHFISHIYQQLYIIRL